MSDPRVTKALVIALLAGVLVAAGPAAAIAPGSAAGGPVAVIAGPSRANPGDLTVLDASGSTAAGFAWVLADSDKTFLEVEQGRKLVFASGTAGKYTFVLVAANADASGRPSVALAKHVLTVGEPGPGPDPNPIPPGPQPDPLPPGKYGLATFARDAAANVQLDGANKNRTAMALAASFDSVAAMIAAGAIKDAQSVIASTQASNITAVGAHRAAWQPWAESLRQKLNSLSDAKQLVSLDDYTLAWREIGVGLRHVR